MEILSKDSGPDRHYSSIRSGSGGSHPSRCSTEFLFDVALLKGTSLEQN